MCRLGDVTTTELLHDCWCYAMVGHWAEESQCSLSSGSGSGSGLHNIATVGRGDTQLTRVVLSLSMLPLKHLYPVDIYIIYYLLSSVNKPGGTGFT